ncbi:hypothetical protein A3728_13440 [Sulfitobacter sp. HI0040]|nr:hypothetical protein A3728_13440 [Sulfitobacter sp. HI0040]KZZ69177.1 hypothetical protein A3764_11685 [Sulfitobacter sp. HI0129]
MWMNSRVQVATCLSLLALPALAQSEAPETSLTPPQLERAEPETSEETSEAPAPVPEPAPVDVDPAETLATDDPPEKTLAITADPAAFAACTAALTELGASFEPVAPIRDEDDGSCGIAQPIRLDAAAPGVALNPDTFLRCETALALSQWVTRTVLPAAEVLSERGAVTSLQHGSSYICRRRNNSPTGKPSEHSYGNALDIMGVGFADGSMLAIEPREREGTLEEAFQDAIRAGACLSFTTVLGPGSDAAHANHLHFDIKARNGGFRLCQ